MLRSTEDLKKIMDEKSKIEKEKEKIKAENNKLKKEKKEIDDQIANLMTEKSKDLIFLNHWYFVWFKSLFCFYF